MGKLHIFLDLIDVVVDREVLEFDALLQLRARTDLDTILIRKVLFIILRLITV